MSKPVVAIPADIREIEGNVWQATPNQYVRAAVKGADVTVFLVPALEADNDFDGILDRVDGLVAALVLAWLLGVGHGAGDVAAGILSR